MRIAFLGTPDFAVPSLKALIAAGHDVAGVFTQPDRPCGRGYREKESAVKQAAEGLGLAVYEFERIRKPEGVAKLREIAPDAMVTAAYGQILSQKLLDIPKLGCVNVHASLLPKYRGAAPIQWAVVNGEAETGVTTMLTDAGVDTGDILLQRAIPVGPNETSGELTVRLSLLGAELLIETLAALEQGKIIRTPQDASAATHFPMLCKDDGRVDWNRSPKAVVDFVRGMNPWPGAWASCGSGGVIKLWRAEQAPFCGEPGAILKLNQRDGFVVGTRGGSVRILELQMQGKRRMGASEYLCGCRLAEGLRLDAG